MIQRIGLYIILAMLSLTVAAQEPYSNHPHGVGGMRPIANSNVVFESQHGVAFTVFIDGNIMNGMPQGRVMVNDVSPTEHEVVVVLRRPAEKAAVLRIIPGEPTVTISVDYDAKNDHLYLYTPPCNRPDTPRKPDRRKDIEEGIAVEYSDDDQPLTEDNPTRMATQDDVDFIVSQLKAISFDSDRLALAKTLLATSLFSSEQISIIGQTLDFSNTQVDFLKYAFSYCYDPRNYSKAMEILAFSSDRKKVADYIATQK